MNYEMLTLVIGCLGLVFLMYNLGVNKIMSTLQDVKDSLSKLATDVNAIPNRGTGPFPGVGPGSVVSQAELDSIKTSIDAIDAVAVSKGVTP